MSVDLRPALLRGAPYFPVTDVAATLSYYQEVVGFREEYRAGSPPEFAICSRDGCGVMLRRSTEPSRIRPMESQGGTWDAFFWVRDAEELAAEFLARGATFVYGLVVQPYGVKEFALRDLDGHVLGFGQQWPAAPTNGARPASDPG
ncbi:MAG: VOC family protein [Gemmatimonadota bacterium]